jgi:hypothetical protein
MAILVRKDPERRYQSLGSIGISSQEQQQADRLDERLKKRVEELVKLLTNERAMPEKKGEGTLRVYWELGRCLRDVVESKDFVNIAELPLLWRNAKMYIPEELLYKDRGPYREHLWYCYRLGGYLMDTVMKMKWGEWVTIFDSSGINQEPRFDKWFNNTLSKNEENISRERIRIFAPCVNAMLGNIDYQDLSENALFNCYEAAWHVSYMVSENKVSGMKIDRKHIQNRIDNKLVLLDSVMEGSMTSYEYAATILDVSN